jgi:hypothetical protein
LQGYAGGGLELWHRFDEGQPGLHGALGIMLVAWE